MPWFSVEFPFEEFSEIRNHQNSKQSFPYELMQTQLFFSGSSIINIINFVHKNIKKYKYIFLWKKFILFTNIYIYIYILFKSIYKGIVCDLTLRDSRNFIPPIGEISYVSCQNVELYWIWDSSNWHVSMCLAVAEILIILKVWLFNFL